MLNSQNSNINKDKINCFCIINNFIYNNKANQYNSKITFNVFSKLK